MSKTIDLTDCLQDDDTPRVASTVVEEWQGKLKQIEDEIQDIEFQKLELVKRQEQLESEKKKLRQAIKEFKESKTGKFSQFSSFFFWFLQSFLTFGF